MTLTPEEAFAAHAAAIASGNLDEIVAGYADDAVFITTSNISRGKDAIRAWYTLYLIDFPGVVYVLTTQIFEGDFLFVEYTGDSATISVKDATATYVFRDGLIRVQAERTRLLIQDRHPDVTRVGGPTANRVLAAKEHEMTLTPEEAFAAHAAALASGNLDEIVAGYADDAVIITTSNVSRGKDAIRAFFTLWLIDFPGVVYDLTTQIFEGDFLFVEYTGDSATISIKNGADTFVFRDGLIRLQTIHYYIRTIEAERPGEVTRSTPLTPATQAGSA
jgi:ketosteroid isomerase-like protein